MCFFKGLCIAVSITFLLMPDPVKAETWVRLDERLTIDVDSILMNGDLRTYWMRFDKGSHFYMSHEIVDCITGRKERMRIVVYNSSGRVVDEKTHQPGETTMYVIPGSNGSMVRNFVCH